MYFHDLYPKAEIGYFSKKYPGLKKSKYITSCKMCNQQTQWFDDHSEYYICSDQCLKELRKALASGME